MMKMNNTKIGNPSNNNYSPYQQQQMVVTSTPRRTGRVQIALLQSLDEHRYDVWKKFYVSSERLIGILTKQHHHHHHATAVTDRFISVLDDEVDKAVVFFLDLQGQIARDLWSLWNTDSTTILEESNTQHAPQELYNHAIQILKLVRFVDLNIRIVERVLSLHDEIIVEQRNTLIAPLYLAGKIGRESQIPHDHHRLSTLLYPDSLRATVGIAATIYYRYIKEQSKALLLLNQKTNTIEGNSKEEQQQVLQSMRATPSMSSLASFLTDTCEDSNETPPSSTKEFDDYVIPEGDEEDNFDPEDNDDSSTSSDGEGNGNINSGNADNIMPDVGDMRMLALTERALNNSSRVGGTGGTSTAAPVSTYSLGVTEDKLIGGVLLRIDTAMAKLTQTSTMMECLALPDLMSSNRRDSFLTRPDSTDDLKGLGEILDEHQKTVGNVKDKTRKYSSWLNLSNSFLYMVSYYLVAPTSSAYARRLGLNDSMSGAIIGMTAFSALASTVLYSWWTSYSYKHALIFSSVCCLFGNIIYAAGLPFDSLTLVLVGRLLNGFGSARAINRRFIADAFSKSERTAASADFVASGAAGMSVGPGLAALMPLLIPKHSNTNLWWQEENSAGWVMAGLWVIYLAFLIPYFKDPPKQQSSNTITPKHHKVKTNLNDMYNGEMKPLIANKAATNDLTTTSATAEEVPLWKRPAALITIFLVFLLKLVLELVLSAAAPVTGYYFDWTPSMTGWFLAALGLLVLPAIWLVTWASHMYDDRQLIMLSVIGTLCGCIITLQYNPPSYTSTQYMIGTIILFIFPNTMEAPTMSLLSKNIPSSLSRGLFNLGFFTTEAGFSGRVVADSVLTWCGSQGTVHLVNNVFGFLTLLNTVALGLVYFYMQVLVDPAKKYE